MKELIYLNSETNDFQGKSYTISTFIDTYNYKILRATNLPNVSKLVSGNKYTCDLDVKFKKGQGFVFFVSKVKI